MPIFGVSADCTSVVGANVKTMGPAMIHVVQESGAPVAPWGSGVAFVGGLIGGPVGWLLDGCKCRSLGL